MIQRVLAVMGNQRASFVSDSGQKLAPLVPVDKSQRASETNSRFRRYDLVQRECLAVSMHRHGCCVMQRSLDHADSATRAASIEQANMLARIVAARLRCSVLTLQHAYCSMLTSLPSQLAAYLTSQIVLHR